MARLVRTFQGIDPYDSSGVKTRLIGLEQDQIDLLLRFRDGKWVSLDEARLARLQMASEVCLNPTVVFGDWKRAEQEDGVCYCGFPKNEVKSLTITVPAPKGMVFCAYVKPSGKLTSWRWERTDPTDSRYPEGFQTRFGGILWPKPTQD